jgi:predicted enzyme related to lactoylglutathione lyase
MEGLLRPAPHSSIRADTSTIAGVLAVAAIVSILAGHAPRASGATARTGEFVWHDLITPDPAASRAFYGPLFGWTFEPGKGVEPNYTIIKQDGYPIGGIVAIANPETVPQWLSYVVVADVDRASAAFTESGGRVYRGPLNVRKDLRVAVVGDGQGAPIGLASRGAEATGGQVPVLNRWLWMEYIAIDAPRALDFYNRTIGYTNEVTETRQGRNYHVFKTDRPRAGLFASLWEREASLWLPYVRVADAAAMAARVTELGGTVVLAPRHQKRFACDRAGSSRCAARAAEVPVRHESEALIP